MRYLSVVLWLFIWIGCGSVAETPTVTPSPEFDTFIEGTVTYRERMALPPAAQVKVGVYDTSLADAAAVPLAETMFEPVGQVPIAWSLPFDESLVDPSHTYTVHAQILVDGQLMFTTTQSYPVLTNGNPQTGIEVVLEKVN